MPFRFPTPRLLEHDFVHKQLGRLHDDLSAVTRDADTVLGGIAHAPEVAAAVRDAIAEAGDDPAARGDYYSHNPLVSLVQSALDQRLASKQLAGEVEHDDERMGDPYTTEDIRWVTKIVVALVARQLEGPHAFNDAPATAALEDDARLVLISDWGTGREGAAAVARMAASYITGPDVTRPVHVIHLGDTYYAGTSAEQRRNLLTPWPVAPADVATIGSWALNGNHDMYSGGHGLFETTLADPRFARQVANGQPTSWFRLDGGAWNVLALDTAWRSYIIELVEGKLSFTDQLGHLHGSQAEQLGEVAHAPKKLLVLSHHQLFDAYGSTYPTPLAGEVQGALADASVTAWFWGHEHDCLAYEPFDGVGAARSIGNGAVPQIVRDGPSTPPTGPLVKPIPSDTLPEHHPMRALTWEYRDYRIGSDNAHWMKHAFAVLDLAGDAIDVTYVDDEGRPFQHEHIA